MQPVQRQARRRIDLGSEAPSYPIYAIGDVHGCLDELRGAEQRIASDIALSGRNGLVVLLGDYVDRGPHSAQVIEHLLTPSELGLRRLALCGNHDDIFSKFLDDPGRYAEWLELGGRSTLQSYGIDLARLPQPGDASLSRLKDVFQDAVPAAHRTYLANLPILMTVGNIVFVHAGIRPRLPLSEQDDEDLMWIRDPFLAQGPGQPLLVVHGHTPHDKPDVGPGRIGIDTGAFYSGKLTVLKIDGDKKTLV